ncbi:NAD(P)H-dependent flavin oxidoreductase [Leuconostoc inhae]|uniref:NAD(P)H-dependent flavin oxidoreductase n=1 Tax=Leuconostoc inhae TaxID=178001 RepID=UPI001C7CC613|nr:nitronate monooxygenase [Leuconostoc inhae]
MKNRICEILNIEKPIIQGPLNWLTNAELVGAVSEAGGLGVLGFNAGQDEILDTPEETKENMRKEIRKVREITNNPIGLNISPTSSPIDDVFTQPMFDLMVEEHVPVAIMVGNLDTEWILKFHEKGIKVVFRAVNPTKKNTQEAVQAGVDIIVATGFDEGGTIPAKAIGTFSMIPMIVDASEGKVPIMAAGGIVDSRSAQAAYALGAEGVYVGTAFLLSKESPLAENIKNMAVKMTAEDLLLYRTMPAYYRSLPGDLPNKLLEMSKSGATEEQIYKAQNGYIGMRDGMLFGDLTKGFASFGLGITFINKIESVARIMDKLVNNTHN